MQTGALPACVFLSADLPGEPPPTGWSLHPQLPPDALDERGVYIVRLGCDQRRQVIGGPGVQVLHERSMGIREERPR